MMENAIAAVCRQCEEGMDAGEIEPSMTDFVATLACTRAALDAPEWRVAAATFDDMRHLPVLIAQMGQKPGLIAGFSAS